MTNYKATMTSIHRLPVSMMIFVKSSLDGSVREKIAHGRINMAATNAKLSCFLTALLSWAREIPIISIGATKVLNKQCTRDDGRRLDMSRAASIPPGYIGLRKQSGWRVPCV